MSEHMFRRPAKTLTLPEAALVAGLLRAPSALSPWSNYDGALERSHLVLTLMPLVRLKVALISEHHSSCTEQIRFKLGVPWARAAGASAARAKARVVKVRREDMIEFL